MHAARFTLHAADLAAVMASMRCWLDKHHTQPLVFICEDAGDGRLVIKLDFVLGTEAEKFAAVFKPPADSQHEHPAAAAPASMPTGVCRRAGSSATAARTARKGEGPRDPRTSPDDDPSRSGIPLLIDATCG